MVTFNLPTVGPQPNETVQNIEYRRGVLRNVPLSSGIEQCIGIHNKVNSKKLEWQCFFISIVQGLLHHPRVAEFCRNHHIGPRRLQPNNARLSQHSGGFVPSCGYCQLYELVVRYWTKEFDKVEARKIEVNSRFQKLLSRFQGYCAFDSGPGSPGQTSSARLARSEQHDASHAMQELVNWLMISGDACVNGARSADITKALFQSIFEKTYTCEDCKLTTVHPTLEYHSTLMLKFPAIKKMKFTLDELFQNIMYNDLMKICDNHKKDMPHKTDLRFTHYPELLSFGIADDTHRTGGFKSFRMVSIPERLDLGDLSFLKGTACDVVYELRSVIKHIGESADQGHYICYTRVGGTGEWACCDDDHVESSTYAEAVAYDRKSGQTPFLLFYERIYPKDTRRKDQVHDEEEITLPPWWKSQAGSHIPSVPEPSRQSTGLNMKSPGSGGKRTTTISTSSAESTLIDQEPDAQSDEQIERKENSVLEKLKPGQLSGSKKKKKSPRGKAKSSKTAFDPTYKPGLVLADSDTESDLQVLEPGPKPTKPWKSNQQIDPTWRLIEADSDSDDDMSIVQPPPVKQPPREPTKDIIRFNKGPNATRAFAIAWLKTYKIMFDHQASRSELIALCNATVEEYERSIHPREDASQAKQIDNETIAPSPDTTITKFDGYKKATLPLLKAWLKENKIEFGSKSSKAVLVELVESTLLEAFPNRFNDKVDGESLPIASRGPTKNPKNLKVTIKLPEKTRAVVTVRKEDIRSRKRTAEEDLRDDKDETAKTTTTRMKPKPKPIKFFVPPTPLSPYEPFFTPSPQTSPGSPDSPLSPRPVKKQKLIITVKTTGKSAAKAKKSATKVKTPAASVAATTSVGTGSRKRLAEDIVEPAEDENHEEETKKKRTKRVRK